MKGRIRFIAWILVILVGSFFVFAASRMYSNGLGSAIKGETPSIGEVVDDISIRRDAILDEDPSVDFGEENEINVLLLGLDSRKGWDNPHCDAIHMMTLDVENWDVTITSVPRGTYAYIPKLLPTGEYYVANACSYVDLDYGIEQIERIVGVKADYVATVGFSQVLGILRAFDLPTTEGLQWLRHRQSYAIGDPQRSRNQAQFVKDVILREAHRFNDSQSKALFYVLYTMVDTDMDFGTARALTDGFLEAAIDQRPDDIVLVMKPHHETQEFHLDFENSEEQIQELLDYIGPRLSKEDFSNRSLESVQNELVNYLELQFELKLVDDVMERRLWLQVEDRGLREDLHYRFIEEYVYQHADEDPEGAREVLTAYIIEKETIEEDVYARRGRGLMNHVLQ